MGKFPRHTPYGGHTKFLLWVEEIGLREIWSIGSHQLEKTSNRQKIIIISRNREIEDTHRVSQDENHTSPLDSKMLVSCLMFTWLPTPVFSGSSLVAPFLVVQEKLNYRYDFQRKTSADLLWTVWSFLPLVGGAYSFSHWWIRLSHSRPLNSFINYAYCKQVFPKWLDIYSHPFLIIHPSPVLWNGHQSFILSREDCQ